MVKSVLEAITLSLIPLCRATFIFFTALLLESVEIFLRFFQLQQEVHIRGGRAVVEFVGAGGIGVAPGTGPQLQEFRVAAPALGRW